MTTRTLFEFQNFGARHVLKQLEKQKAYLLADEMGLGKSIQAITVARHLVRENLLIVCPASLIDNWHREIEKWAPEILHKTVICSYHRLAKAIKIPGGVGPLIDFCIIDEAHYLRSPKTKWTQFVSESLYPACKKMLFLTGTPMPNYPIQLQPMLALIAPSIFGDYWAFARRYANAHRERIPQKSVNGVRQSKEIWNVKGASNIDELRQLALNKCMLRRTKKQVLAQLPPKIYTTIYLDGVKCAPTLDIDWRDIWPEQLEMLARQEHVSTARRILGAAKCQKALDYIALLLEETPKLVVFAHHREVIQKLCYALQNYGVVSISGETPVADRARAINAFQFDSRARVFVGSIQASGVGITLTAASTVVFVERDWTPGNNEQAEDRCHRIGQHDSVQVITLIAGELDEAVEKILAKKITHKQQLGL